MSLENSPESRSNDDEVVSHWQIGDDKDAAMRIIVNGGEMDIDSVLKYIADISAIERSFVTNPTARDAYKRVLVARVLEKISRRKDIFAGADFINNKIRISFVDDPQVVEKFKDEFKNSLARVHDFMNKKEMQNQTQQAEKSKKKWFQFGRSK